MFILVSMGNGYSESCDEITDPLKLDDDDSIVFYLNEQVSVFFSSDEIIYLHSIHFNF